MAQEASVSALQASFASAHEAVVDGIETAGYKVGAVLPMSDMLERTAADHARGPYEKAEVIQFCSGRVARMLAEESPELIVICPLSVAVYTLPTHAGKVFLAYRLPGEHSAGRREATALLERVVAHARAWAGYR